MSADDLKKACFSASCPRKHCARREKTEFLEVRELRVHKPMKRLICAAETQNIDAVNVFISPSFPQAVMSRALSAMGRASRSVCHVQTPPLCSETGSALASAARLSTVRPESATVKKT